MWYLTSQLGRIHPLPCLFRRAHLSLMGALMISVFMSQDLRAQASVVTGSVTISKTAYTVGVGSNRAIVVVVSDEKALGTLSVSGITWGGQALTLVRRQNGSALIHEEMWYLNETGIQAAGTNCTYNFVVTWSDVPPTNESFIALTLQDVDQTTPVAASSSSTANSNTIAFSGIAAGVNDIVVYGTASNANAATVDHTEPGTYIEQVQKTIASTTSQAVAIKQITTAATETATATWASSARLVIIGAVFNGVAATPSITYYSRATGDWDSNTSWSLSADGSSGAVAAGVWPRRIDNVVINSGHTITINAVNDNKSCGLTPDALGRINIGPFTFSNSTMFYQTGNMTILGNLTVSGIEIMVEGFTRVAAGGTFLMSSSIVNLGNLEAEASSTLSIFNSLILAGNSTTAINTTSTLSDDLIISFTDATLCGTGVAALQNGLGSQITYANSATVAQICNSFRVTCSGTGCTSGFPVTGTGTTLVGNVGPGGVGYSSNNRLWLRASDLSLANNANVASWADVSGNSLTATQSVAASQPRFATNSVNGFPSIRFDGTLDGTNDFLNLGNPAVLNLIPGTNSWTLFIVYNVPNGTQGTLLSKATDANRQYLYTIDDNGSSRFTSYIGGTGTIGSVTATAAWFVSAHTNTTTRKDSWTNEGANFTNEAIGTAQQQTCDVLIGARRDTGPTTGTGFMLAQGNIAEIAMYDKVVNTAQRIIIDNAFAAKYDFTLSTNDVYTMDGSGFDYEVAGIGQATDGSNHRDARGSGIVRMWNPSGLNNDEYLMWGHDGTLLYSSTAAGVGAPIEERLSRTWRVDKFGDPGTVSVSFDISLLGTPLGSNLRLLIDRNGNGFTDNDVTPLVGSYVGNTVVFSNVNFQDGDRFTLGNTNIDDPLPVTLVSFRAEAEERTVHLSWTTASETNNDFFTVERSRNAQQWESVQRIPGAGTSKVMNHYETVDDGPYRGASYYRLKQTDFDLQSKYSDLVRVVLDHETPITLHPNPFHDHVRLLIDFAPEQSEVKLYNSSGAEVPFTMKKEGADLIINPGNIPQGLYILKVLDRFVIRTAKLIKE